MCVGRQAAPGDHCQVAGWAGGQTGEMEIKSLSVGDEQFVDAAAHLFDQPPDRGATTCFLADPRHHLLIAYAADQPVGFVTGVEMTHPDKGTEMFLYELEVDERFRRNGFGRALVDALADRAQARGCYGMWVITDAQNRPALATYTSAGGSPEPHQVVLAWTF